MSVAFGGTVPAIGRTTGTTKTSGNWAISGANLAIIVQVTFLSTSITVTSVSWSLGSGTPIKIKSIRGGSGNATTVELWAIPAPVSGTGTITVNLSSSTQFNCNADYFTGADQTTPCPTADAVTDVTATNVYTLTPANLSSGDAASSGSANSSELISSVAPNQTLIDNSGNVDIGTGYRIGVGSITVTMSGSSNSHANVAVRIAAAGAVRGLFRPPNLATGAGGSFFPNPVT